MRLIISSAQSSNNTCTNSTKTDKVWAANDLPLFDLQPFTHWKHAVLNLETRLRGKWARSKPAISRLYQVIKFVIAASLQSKRWQRKNSPRSRTFACSPLLVRLSGPALLCSGRRGGERRSQVYRYDMNKKQTGNRKEKKRPEDDVFLCLFTVLQRWNTRSPDSAECRETRWRGLRAHYEMHACTEGRKTVIFSFIKLSRKDGKLNMSW